MPFVRYSEMDVFVFGPDGEKNWGPDSPRGGLQNVNKTKHNSITPLNISHLRCFVHGRLLDRNRQKSVLVLIKQH